MVAGTKNKRKPRKREYNQQEGQQSFHKRKSFSSIRDILGKIRVDPQCWRGIRFPLIPCRREDGISPQQTFATEPAGFEPLNTGLSFVFFALKKRL